MIVTTMSLPEVYQEVIRDYDSVKRRGKGAMKALQSEVFRTKRFVTTRYIEYESKSHNKWNIQVRTTQKDVGFSYFIRSYDTTGLIAFNVVEDINRTKYLVKYSTHFFKRYNERMKLNETNMEKLVRRYFKFNSNLDHKMGNINGFEDGTAQTYLAGSEGVALGWLDRQKNLLCIKTFVTNEMLKGEQIDFVKQLRGDAPEEAISFPEEHIKESKEKFI
jgi:hypothetical protein